MPGRSHRTHQAPPPQLHRRIPIPIACVLARGGRSHCISCVSAAAGWLLRSMGTATSTAPPDALYQRAGVGDGSRAPVAPLLLALYY
jgi:hypothetical protein